MNPKILVADDDDRIRKMIRISLNASHYEVIESTTIQETILKTAKYSPDFIGLTISGWQRNYCIKGDTILE